MNGYYLVPFLLGHVPDHLRLINPGYIAYDVYPAEDDLQTAGLAGVQSTGNGERGGGTLPSPSASNLVFDTGDTPFEEMVRGIGEGLVVEQLMGASQTNVLGGEFSGNVLLGYKVERGEIVGRVKDTVVSGNIYEALKELVGIGSEGRWIGGMVYTPAFCCANLRVVSKS